MARFCNFFENRVLEMTEMAIAMSSTNQKMLQQELDGVMIRAAGN